MVPFVRVTRDKRGYEHIYLMRASGRRGKAGAPRVLYVFRTPPGIKVGREPFDDLVRRTLEEQNPGVYFDWKKLSVITPPPDVEYWRERRRIEKAAKQAQREEAAAQASASEAAIPAEPDDDQTLDDADQETESSESEPAELTASPAEPESLVPPGSSGLASAPHPQGQRRRRRRRGGRGRRRPTGPEVSAQVPADSPKVADDPSKER